jgi:holo-[acyl-carrier protein] synthase
MLKTGIDLIDIPRLEGAIQRHGARFLDRIFTPGEIQEAQGRLTSLAARFAAKEAVAKALGTGIGAVGWLEIEIRYGPAREPVLHLHGEAARLAAELGLETWAVSLSHTEGHAVAVAVATGKAG